MVAYLFEGLETAVGDAVPQQLDLPPAPWFGGEDGFQRGNKGSAVLHAGGVGDVAGVFGQRVGADGGAEGAPLGVGGRGDGEVGFVLAEEGLLGDDGGRGAAPPLGGLAAAEVFGDAGVLEPEGGAEHGGVHAESAPSFAAADEGFQDGEGDDLAGVEVDVAIVAEVFAGAAKFAVEGDEAAEGLDGAVGAAHRAHGAGVSPGAGGDVEDGGVDASDVGHAESDAVGDAGAEVFDEDVAVFEDVVSLGAISLILEVELDAALAQVAVGVDDAVAPLLGGDVVDEVAVGRLDFDDVGAEAGEEHGGPGADGGVGHVEDGDVGEGAGHGGLQEEGWRATATAGRHCMRGGKGHGGGEAEGEASPQCFAPTREGFWPTLVSPQKGWRGKKRYLAGACGVLL